MLLGCKTPAPNQSNIKPYPPTADPNIITFGPPTFPLTQSSSNIPPAYVTLCLIRLAQPTTQICPYGYLCTTYLIAWISNFICAASPAGASLIAPRCLLRALKLQEVSFSSNHIWCCFQFPEDSAYVTSVVFQLEPCYWATRMVLLNVCWVAASYLICFVSLLLYARATVFQLYHGNDMMYEMRTRKPEPTHLAFDDAVSYMQCGNGLRHKKL